MRLPQEWAILIILAGTFPVTTLDYWSTLREKANSFTPQSIQYIQAQRGSPHTITCIIERHGWAEYNSARVQQTDGSEDNKSWWRIQQVPFFTFVLRMLQVPVMLQVQCPPGRSVEFPRRGIILQSSEQYFCHFADLMGPAQQIRQNATIDINFLQPNCFCCFYFKI